MKLALSIAAALALVSACKNKGDKAPASGSGAVAGSAAGSGSAAPTPTEPGSAAPGSAEPTATGSADPTAAATGGECKYISAADVGAIVGTTVTGSTDPTGCRFHVENGPSITILVTDTGEDYFKSASEGGEAVANLGDKASYGPGASKQNARLVVLRGGKALGVTGADFSNKSDMKAATKAVAEKALPKL